MMFYEYTAKDSWFYNTYFKKLWNDLDKIVNDAEPENAVIENKANIDSFRKD